MTLYQTCPFHEPRDSGVNRHARPELDSAAAQHILNLVVEVDYFRNLLASQTSHLLRLQSATANVASLVAENPNMPGRSAVTALQGVIHTLRRSLESAAALLDKPHDVVEPTAILSGKRSGTTGALPSRSLRHHWEPSRRWDITPSDDPFIDAPPKPACRSASYALEYHPDVAGAPWHKLYEDPPSSAAADLQPRSRRVVLSNLPPDTTVSQVLGGLCRRASILSASVVSPFGARAGRGSAKSAVVEFADAASAAACVDGLRERPLTFLDACGAAHEGRAWLIPTHSYALTSQHRELLRHGATRALSLGPIPVGAVWRLLSLVGTGQMAEVWYDGEQEDLVVEFASLFEADRARAFVEHEWPLNPPCPLARPRVRFVRDPYPGCWRDMDDRLSHVQRHVPRYHVEQDWNRAPYNELGPKEHARASPSLCSSGYSGLPRHDRKPASPSPTEALAASLAVSPSQLSSYLGERAGFDDSEHRIVGSAWERYGMLARHRRDQAAKQGLEAWRASCCDPACAWGCRDLRTVPVPRVVQQYFDAMRLSTSPSQKPGPTTASWNASRPGTLGERRTS